MWYIGHWGSFLDASLALAQQQGGLDYEALLNEEFREQGKLPKVTPPGPADLIMYSYVGNGGKWLETAANLNLTATWEAFLMVHALAGSSMRQAVTPGVAEWDESGRQKRLPGMRNQPAVM